MICRDERKQEAGKGSDLKKKNEKGAEFCEMVG